MNKYVVKLGNEYLKMGELSAEELKSASDGEKLLQDETAQHAKEERLYKKVFLLLLPQNSYLSIFQSFNLSISSPKRCELSSCFNLALISLSLLTYRSRNTIFRRRKKH